MLKYIKTYTRVIVVGVLSLSILFSNAINVNASSAINEFTSAKKSEGVERTLWAEGLTVSDTDFYKHIDGDAEYFVTKHSSNKGWYDINKTYIKDGVLCAGVTAANMLHWWADRNKAYIDRYLDLDKENGVIRINDKVYDFREARKMYNLDEYVDQSKFFDIVKNSFNTAVWTDKILDLYINGYHYKADFEKNVPREVERLSNINFFQKVFGATLLTDVHRVYSLTELSNLLRSAFERKKMVGLGYYPNINVTGHMVTIWGADFNSSGQAIAIYLTDSDDDSEKINGTAVGIKRLRLTEYNGKIKITGYKDEGSGAEVGFITTLDQGKKNWDEYFKKPEVLNKEKENKRKLEEAKLEAKRKEEESKRKSEEARRKAEEAKKEEARRKAEEAKKEEAKRKAEEAKKEEARRKAEEAKREEARRKAEEAKKEEARRKAEEAKKEEARRKAEEAKKEEARRKAEEAKKKLYGWHKISNKWYFFNNNANLETGWLLDGKTWYYLDKSGIMQTGWVKTGGKWYYMSGSGAMQTGWVKTDGKWYYMSGSGAMQTGWVKTDGKWYYMSGSGAMQTGWVKTGGKWYYMSGSGAMQTGWVKTGGKWYYMSGSGAMQTGWIKDSGKWYYLDNSGKLI